MAMAMFDGSAMRWHLELGDHGQVPELPGDQEGVLRIGSDDTVIIVLPSGSTPTLFGMPKLVIFSELDEEKEEEGVTDGKVGDWAVEWHPERPGPYELCVRYPTGVNGEVAQSPQFGLIVEPTLRVNDAPLPARAITQLTVLSRLGGPIEKWPENLQSQGALGYNMVHFTPIQPPGESGSCYALDDQHAVETSFFESPPADQKGRLEVVKKSVQRLEKENGMLSAMDIVLNHTAGSSPWLLDHPECAYNITNSPHLIAAAELDEKLVWFGDELRHGRYGGPHINTPEDVDRVIDGIRNTVLEPFKLHEYFVINQDACFKARAESRAHFERDDYNAFKDGFLASIGVRRHGVVVDGDAAKKFTRDDGHMKQQIHRLQQELFDIHDGIKVDIIDCLRGFITWERLEVRKGPVGEGHMELCPRFFRRLKLSPEGAKRAGKDTEVVAHNGWVMGWPATEDFGAPNWRFVYLRRHLCAWGDCVKLYYGNKPEDVPYVWDYMTKYATSQAEIFHAIRLDNAHSTPLHVSKHVLAQVRKTNPHCWIFAELFTGNFNTDLLYQRKLGINALIRESMQCGSPNDISGKLQSSLWGAHPIGALSPVPMLDRDPLPPVRENTQMSRSCSGALVCATILPLRPRHCPALLFDCTHDNETPNQKRHPADALPNAALTAASCASIGSVRGYDELVPTNPSVVFERRQYEKIDGIQPLDLSWAEMPKPVPVNTNVEPTTFEIAWNKGAQTSVVVRGGWDGWKADVPLTKQGDGRWTTSMTPNPSALPLQYKFIVDGTWTCDDSQPTMTDSSGNKNNVLAQPGVKVGGGQTGGSDCPVNKYGKGILAVKQVLNNLHVKLGLEGFTEVGVQHLCGDVVAVQRRCPESGKSTWFVTRSAYWRDSVNWGLPGDMATLSIPGSVKQLHVAATLFVNPEHESKYRQAHDHINGLDCFLHVYGNIGEVAHMKQDGDYTHLTFHKFPAGSVLCFSVDSEQQMARHNEVLAHLSIDSVEEPLRNLPLGDLSYLLYSCEAEESDRSDGKRSAFDIPGHGPMVYCGLMGICAVLDNLRNSSTDMNNSAVAGHLRDGDWLLDYLVSRVADAPQFAGVHAWMVKARMLIQRFPRQLVPFYFDLLISMLCSQASTMLLMSSGPFVQRFFASSPLIRDLTLASAQFWGATKSAPLHWDRALAQGWRTQPSLSAGLPHFSSGFMRNWGRDTFIALRGCLLVTQRFAEAKETILVYGSVVRHGLCPNLHDAANNPRYNARDATWFFLQAVQDYCNMAPEGLDFLNAPMTLKWKVGEWDEELAHLEPKTVAELIHLILAAHAKGIKFREWRAGPAIDEHMTDNGFNISVSLDENTGIIYGGNEQNCGTWMDKMGSSANAGNKGVPATPRDGADIEIVALLKSTLRWVSGMTERFPHNATVKTASGKDLSYGEWNKRLEENFEKSFWAEECGWYKDTIGATRKWQDTQLRPNLCIAMTVAPECFTPDKAKRALKVVSERLIGPLGMLTLDPTHGEYRGDYHNDNDSQDKSIAHGFNYHQGPEWVWPLGFFLQAWVLFNGTKQGKGAAAPKSDEHPAMQSAEVPAEKRVMRWLLEHRKMLSTDEWRSLPELTNSRGQVCHHSCPAQAWSIACLLDALCTVEGGMANF